MTEDWWGWKSVLKRFLGNILVVGIFLLGFFILMGGGNYLVCHITGHPYYTEFNAENGLYCVDKSGWLWGYPPGYVYKVTIPTPDWYDDSGKIQHYMTIERYNQSAWIPADQWPSCTEYGEP
ncbi:MAG: hypothetical protein WCX22_06090 [Methanoregula sp.]